MPREMVVRREANELVASVAERIGAGSGQKHERSGSDGSEQESERACGS